MIYIATLKEIAEAADVSVMTVSNVVNGKHNKVSKKTIEKISRLIEEMGYVPNETARSLATKKSNLIALCIPNYNQTKLLENPYNSHIVGVISRYAEKNNFKILLDSETEPQQIVNKLQSWNVAGVIFFGLNVNDMTYIEEKLAIPLVCLDGYYPSANLTTIGTNDYQGGWLAGRYLTGLGHKTIAYASGPSILETDTLSINPLLHHRYQGFKDALAENGTPLLKENIFTGDITFEMGKETGISLARRTDITAIFCTADILAIGVMEGARLSGIKIPNDLSVLGFDNLEIAKYVSPKLSSIDQNNANKGIKTVDTLMALMDNPEIKMPSVRFETEIMERQSTAAFVKE